MSYNWQLDLEKLHKAYERACDDNDTSKQESLSEEIRQIEDIIQAKEIEQQEEPKKHWLTKSAERMVKDRDVYKHQTWHHENVDLYSMFYGALTSIMEHKHTAATKVKEVKAMMEAFEAAKKIIRD